MPPKIPVSDHGGTQEQGDGDGEDPPQNSGVYLGDVTKTRESDSLLILQAAEEQDRSVWSDFNDSSPQSQV